MGWDAFGCSRFLHFADQTVLFCGGADILMNLKRCFKEFSSLISVKRQPPLYNDRYFVSICKENHGRTVKDTTRNLK